jgi:hypothetical protein
MRTFSKAVSSVYILQIYMKDIKMIAYFFIGLVITTLTIFTYKVQLEVILDENYPAIFVFILSVLLWPVTLAAVILDIVIGRGPFRRS